VILDTGVDATHPQILAARAEKRIIAAFPDSADPTLDSTPKSLDPFRDEDGHGTHVASVLLRTAPNAAIYIAKVFDDDLKLNDDIVKVHY
jgi:subtilisin family serine protease